MKPFFTRSHKNAVASKAEMQHLHYKHLEDQTRRTFLTQSSCLLGSAFLASLAPNNAFAAGQQLDFSRPGTSPLAPLPPQYPAKAKRVIYMHMVGAPSQLELFDYKPILEKYNGKLTPKEFLEGKQFAFISGVPNVRKTFYWRLDNVWARHNEPKLTRIYFFGVGYKCA